MGGLSSRLVTSLLVIQAPLFSTPRLHSVVYQSPQLPKCLSPINSLLTQKFPSVLSIVRQSIA